MTSIAEKYAAQFMPNGEVSLADLIQAAVDEAQSVPVVVDADARRCRACTAPRKGDTCWKCGGPTFKPHHSWVEAELPDVARIRALAKEVGYAIGEHGSRERDFDLIAVPWAEGAVGFDELVKHIAVGINAYEVGDRESKPHGRVGVNLQIDGYYKLIDLSVMPLFIPAAELATLREKAAEADELRKDAERLQFMIDETAILMYSVGIDRTLCRVEWPLTGYVQDAFYPSERAAIDAAIAQGKGE